MARFSDELIGSEGERCIVTLPPNGERVETTIAAVHENGASVSVNLPGLGRYYASHRQVELLDHEDAVSRGR